jgi:hypothetical protein
MFTRKNAGTGSVLAGRQVSGDGMNTQKESIKWPTVGARERAMPCRCARFPRTELHAIPAGSSCQWAAVLDHA